MTIEEKIQKKSEEYGELAQIFIEGANFALDNLWISVDEDLPCNHKELTDWACDTTNVIVTGLTNNGRRFRYFDHMTKNGKAVGRWHWTLPYDEYNISYWMPYPKVPKINQ